MMRRRELGGGLGCLTSGLGEVSHAANLLAWRNNVIERARARARGAPGAARADRTHSLPNAQGSSLSMGDRRPLSPGFRGTCRQTRHGGGLPKGEEGGIPAGITHSLVLQIDLPARKAEREERLLAMHGGNVNKTLEAICEEGGGKDARFLLAHRADASYVGWNRVSVFGRAAHNGHLAVVEALLDAGAGELGGSIALVQAASRGHTAVAALLLDRGADVHFKNDDALNWAAYHGHLETATLLLQRGASALGHHAAVANYFGHRAVADLLRAHGAT